MCLAVPGKVLEIKQGEQSENVDRTATIDFQGSQIDVGMAFVPEAKVGDWVLVHAGFALSVLDEEEARETWEYLQFEEQVREELEGMK